MQRSFQASIEALGAPEPKKVDSVITLLRNLIFFRTPSFFKIPAVKPTAALLTGSSSQRSKTRRFPCARPARALIPRFNAPAERRSFNRKIQPASHRKRVVSRARGQLTR